MPSFQSASKYSIHNAFICTVMAAIGVTDKATIMLSNFSTNFYSNNTTKSFANLLS